jgi:hypothetical protein
MAKRRTPSRPPRAPKIADRVDKAFRQAAAADAPEIEIPLPDEGAGSEQFWCDQIEASRSSTDKEVEVWKPILESYNGERVRQTYAANENEQINATSFLHASKKSLPCSFRRRTCKCRRAKPRPRPPRRSCRP